MNLFCLLNSLSSSKDWDVNCTVSNTFQTLQHLVTVAFADTFLAPNFTKRQSSLATIWFFSVDTVRDQRSGISDFLQDILFFHVPYCLCNFGLSSYRAPTGMNLNWSHRRVHGDVLRRAQSLYQHPWKHSRPRSWSTFPKEQVHWQHMSDWRYSRQASSRQQMQQYHILCFYLHS